MLKMAFMGAITEGFVLGQSATADANDLTSAEVINITFLITDLKITFNTQ